ncbi:MAG TPA: HPP family protein [Blastocatellia bacterium]|nr:HPP family protein [Blastocatellia bacterium]
MSQERIAALTAALPATVGGYVGLAIAFFTAQPIWIQFALALGPVLLAGLLQMANTWLRNRLERRSNPQYPHLEESLKKTRIDRDRDK